MLRYWEVWCLIIAQAGDFAWCNRSLWLIDGFAGNGLHPSNAHPDGYIAGTPVQAFRAAALTRRRFPDLEVHLRAVDKSKPFAQELERRLVRAPGAAATKPEWRVMPETFARALPRILSEIVADRGHTHSSGPTYRDHHHRSLWFVDPRGIEPIPHGVLDPLATLPGAEVIINLDLGGLLRVAGAALKALERGDPDSFFAAAIKAGNERRLDETWGGDGWKSDLRTADPGDILRSIARGYANTFPAFPFREAYPLRGTRSQKRYLVHLTHSDVAADRFSGAWRAAFNLDTVASGDQLSSSQRAWRAGTLHSRFRRSILSVQEMYELGAGASRQQIRGICRTAEEGGMGEYDVDLDRMTWFAERKPNPTLGLFPDEGP
jgi:three-Cys-motif partner protein